MASTLHTQGPCGSPQTRLPPWAPSNFPCRLRKSNGWGEEVWGRNSDLGAHFGVSVRKRREKVAA